MSENIENLILEHLRALRNELRHLRTEVTTDLALIKQRLTSIESQVAGAHADMALLHGRSTKSIRALTSSSAVWICAQEATSPSPASFPIFLKQSN